LLKKWGRGLKPKCFFVTSGKGVSEVSPLNAIDNALRDAGIAHLNIVKVTSILPAGIREKQSLNIEPGTVAFAVMTHEVGTRGDTISAGIAWARGDPYGYIVEAHVKNSSKDVKTILEEMLKEVSIRSNLVLEKPKFRIEKLKIQDNTYGAVIAALVFEL